jgi:hypothetical protein
MSKKYIFTESDYNSDDGMMTAVWGPPMWHVLHTISFNYPINPSNEDKINYYNYYNNLKYILPCKYCRDNLTANYNIFPLTKHVFKNRDCLSRYVYELHEIVNTNLKKKSGLSYEDVRERYEHLRSRCIESKKSNKEKGCTEPLYGVKSKCVLNIIPKDDRTKSIKINPKCIIKKI